MRSDGNSPSTQPATTTVCHSRPAAARIDVTVTASPAVAAAESTRQGSAATPSSSRTAEHVGQPVLGVAVGLPPEGVEEGDQPVEDGIGGSVVVAVGEVAEGLLPDEKGQVGGGVDGGPGRQLVTEGDEGRQPGIVGERGLVEPGPQAHPAGFDPVEVGQGRHQEPVEGGLVAVDPPQHVDDGADDGVVGHRGQRRRPGGDAVAGEGAGDGSGPVPRPADEHGHVGPGHAGGVGGQQLARHRLRLDRRMTGGDEHRRLRAAEPVVGGARTTSTSAGNRVSGPRSAPGKPPTAPSRSPATTTSGAPRRSRIVSMAPVAAS